jgi:hypothetical protein
MCYSRGEVIAWEKGKGVTQVRIRENLLEEVETITRQSRRKPINQDIRIN